jgi:ABC-type glycerol-3-phosphate transport system substrate-binding protein
MNFVDSDLNMSGMNRMVAKSATSFWGSIYDSAEGREYLASFTKVPPEEVVDKIWLTMAGTYIDWDVRERVINFNKNSDQYRIQLVEYSNLYNTAEDYMAGADRLNSDIASGRVPDILLISNDLPVQNYMHMGLFADLKPFVDKDEELDMADLIPNVVEAYSVDGEWYQLVPEFVIMTTIAKSSIVGTEPGWTLKEATDLVAGRPEESELFESMTRDSMLQYVMWMGSSQFVDWATGSCAFDGEAFIELLEYIKSLPAEIDYSTMEGRYDDFNDYLTPYRNGRILAMPMELYSLSTFNRMEKEYFGEQSTPIGFPTEEGNGSTLMPRKAFAMSAHSANQDGAWEFLRYYLTDEYQISEDNYYYGLPISMEAFNMRAEEATQRPFYLDENGEKVETDDYYMIDGQEVIVEPMTPERLEEIKNFIFSVNTTVEINDALLNIIQEEAAPYFEDQKSVQEVVDIIQSRAQIYVSENS